MMHLLPDGRSAWQCAKCGHVVIRTPGQVRDELIDKRCHALTAAKGHRMCLGEVQPYRVHGDPVREGIVREVLATHDAPYGPSDFAPKPEGNETLPYVEGQRKRLPFPVMVDGGAQARENPYLSEGYRRRLEALDA